MTARPRRLRGRARRNGIRGRLDRATLNVRTSRWLAARFWRAARSDVRRAVRRRRRLGWR